MRESVARGNQSGWRQTGAAGLAQARRGTAVAGRRSRLERSAAAARSGPGEVTEPAPLPEIWMRRLCSSAAGTLLRARLARRSGRRRCRRGPGGGRGGPGRRTWPRRPVSRSPRALRSSQIGSAGATAITMHRMSGSERAREPAHSQPGQRILGVIRVINRSPKPSWRITRHTRVIIAIFFDPICGDGHPCITRSARDASCAHITLCDRSCSIVLSVFACRGLQAIAAGVLRPCAMRDGGCAAARAPWRLACGGDQSL